MRRATGSSSRANGTPARLLTVFLSLVLVAVACASETAETTTTEEGATTTEGATTSPPTTEGEPSDDIPRGGDVRIALASDNVTLDAHFVSTFVDRVAADAIYDALLTYDENTNLLPALAESWEVSSDGLEITFELREGVMFHDGTPFNAEAAVWNIERMTSADVNSMQVGRLSVITAAEALDEYTLRIQLDQPSAEILPNLTGALGAYMVSPTAVEEMGAEEFASNPVGTGPFVFEEWQRGSSLSVVRNENFWVEGQPYVDRLVFVPIPDPTVMTLTLESGDVDIIQGIAIQEFERLSGNEAVTIHEGFGGNDRLYLNTQKPPLDVLENRQAIQAAIDYEAIHQVAYLGLGQRSKGIPYPPSSAAWDPTLPDLEQDLESARELLAAAGNPDGFDIEVVWFDQETFRQAAQIIQASLAEVGINMTLTQVEFAEFVEYESGGNADAYHGGITATRTNRLEPAGWPSGNLLCDARGNAPQWCNPQFDELLSSGLATPDEAERLDLYQQAGLIILEEVPIVYYGYPPRLQATGADIQNYQIDGTGKLGFREVWISS